MAASQRKPGAMGPHIDGFRAWLVDHGYAQGTVSNELMLAGRLGRWMCELDLEPGQLDEAAVAAFLASWRTRGRRRAPGPRSLKPLLDYLRTQGVVGLSAVAAPVDSLVAHYSCWMVEERGLAPTTVRRYETTARRFLAQRAAVDGNRFVEGVTATTVHEFLLGELARLRVGSAKGRAGELRSLLRFLYLQAMTPVALADAVPPVAGWRDGAVPAGLAASEVVQLVDSCDRGTPGGIRDHAMLILVARLGLRSVEVARLELGDIDWRAGELLVRGKAHRRDRLPLPVDVGGALSRYLCQARPTTPIRQVFLATKAPSRAISPDLVGDVTRRACDRANLPRVGAHRLRHALATDMLCRGAALTAISQVLRHCDLSTTAIYAKVDYARLRLVAQPWPGGQQ
jgi:site-specific recombinase XerD